MKNLRSGTRLVNLFFIFHFSFFIFLISPFPSHIMRIREGFDFGIGAEYDEDVPFFKDGIGFDDPFGDVNDFIDAEQVFLDALADDRDNV